MRIFAICPRVKKQSGRIVATTAWRVCLIFLGTIYRKVVIDPTNETISIFSCYLWFIRFRRVVHFKDVRAVTYGLCLASGVLIPLPFLNILIGCVLGFGAMVCFSLFAPQGE